MPVGLLEILVIVALVGASFTLALLFRLLRAWRGRRNEP